MDLRNIESFGDSNVLLVSGLTAVVLFLGTLAEAYQAALGESYSQTFTLSPIEWITYSFGHLLVEPVLLFVALYYVGSRIGVPSTPTVLLPGLILAVVGGNLVGTWIGANLWTATATDLPLIVLFGRTNVFILDPPILKYWEAMIEPLVRDLVTVVAAFSFAGAMQSNE